jgi:hypothetical protein
VASTAPIAATIPVASPVFTAPTASTVPVASPVLTAPIASTVPVASPVFTAPTASTVPVASPVLTAPTASAASTTLKQLSPDRPEVLIQAYLAEKTAWLARHPTVRPIEYRKARKWKTPRPKILKEQVFYMPRERRDFTGTIIANKANWTNEEIIVWLDNEEKKEQDEYKELELEFVRNGNKHTENGPRDMWARLAEEHARDSERYIL